MEQLGFLSYHRKIDEFETCILKTWNNKAFVSLSFIIVNCIILWQWWCRLPEANLQWNQL